MATSFPQTNYTAHIALNQSSHGWLMRTSSRHLAINWSWKYLTTEVTILHNAWGKAEPSLKHCEEWDAKHCYSCYLNLNQNNNNWRRKPVSYKHILSSIHMQSTTQNPLVCFCHFIINSKKMTKRLTYESENTKYPKGQLQNSHQKAQTTTQSPDETRFQTWWDIQ